MTELSREAFLTLLAEIIVENTPEGADNPVWEELIDAGLWDSHTGKLTKAGRDYLKDKRIVIVDATDAKVHVIEDTHLDNIKHRNEDVGARVLKAAQPDGIGYVKL